MKPGIRNIESVLPHHQLAKLPRRERPKVFHLHTRNSRFSKGVEMAIQTQGYHPTIKRREWNVVAVLDSDHGERNIIAYPLTKPYRRSAS